MKYFNWSKVIKAYDPRQHGPYNILYRISRWIIDAVQSQRAVYGQFRIGGILHGVRHPCLENIFLAFGCHIFHVRTQLQDRPSKNASVLLHQVIQRL